MSTLQLGLLFSAEVLAIFILSRLTLQKSYPLLKRFVKSDKAVVAIIAFIYLPGTFIHELSHFIVALLLRLHPSEIQLLPVITGRKVKLGHVLYEKYPHDFIRPILVGIAPLFGGILTLWLIIQSNLFPGTAMWQTVFFGYIIVAISANMFSSKQDLIDVGYLIPIFGVLIFLYYLFPITFSPQIVNQLVTPITFFLQTLQNPLLFSLGIHAILVVLLSLL